MQYDTADTDRAAARTLWGRADTHKEHAMTTLDAHITAVSNAEATYAAAKKALLAPDGTRRYSDTEHARREAEARVAYQRTYHEAGEAAQAEIETAERELSRAFADPTGKLATDELARANALRAFVAEDCDRLPLGTLADRVEDARTGDRATQYLHWRYAAQRLDKERAGDNPYATLSGDGERLATAVRALEHRFVDTRRRAELEKQVEAARSLIGHVAITRHLATTYGER